MSKQEKDDLVIMVKAANRPLMRVVVVTLGVVCTTVISATTVLVNTYRDVKDIKEFKVKAEPKIELLDKQVTVINFKLNIK